MANAAVIVKPNTFMAPSHKELPGRAKKKQKPTQRDDFELRDLIKIECQFPIPAAKGARPLNAA